MSIRPRALIRSSLLLSACLSACTGGQSGQPAIGPRQLIECHSLGVDEEGFRQTPQDVLDAFPSQTDVPTYWMNAAIEDATTQLEQSDVIAETRMTFTVTRDDSRDIRECLTKVCPAEDCTDGDTFEATMVVPVIVTLMTDDGVSGTFAMELFSYAPVTAYPINAPTLQWHTIENGPNLPNQLSSKAPWASPGFGEFALSYGEKTFMGRFNHPERGLAVWPTPCGGQLQVSANEALDSQPSVAPLFDAIGRKQLSSSDASGPPDIVVTVALDDPTVCYDARGDYHVDARVMVETDGASFERTASVSGNLAHETKVLGAWEDVCGDVSSSTNWSNQVNKAVGGGEICVDAELRKTKKGISLALEVETTMSNAAGSRIGWTYTE